MGQQDQENGLCLLYRYRLHLLEKLSMLMWTIVQPLSVGTAPDWHSESILHHLFDIVTTPSDYTVIEYKSSTQKLTLSYTRGASLLVWFRILYFLFLPHKHHCVKTTTAATNIGEYTY